MPPSNLNIYLQSQELSSILETDITEDTLLSYINCPICKSHKLIIYQHPTEGYWFFCEKCNFAGDGIEIVSSYKDLVIPQTIQYLTDRKAFSIPKADVNQRIQPYIDNFITYRNIINTLWKKCQLDLVKNPVPQWREIMLKKGWRVDNEAIWSQTLGKHIGGAHRHTIENCLFGRTGRLFRADKWGWVVVLPWYELPGKLSGFTFLNHENCIRWDLATKRSRQKGESGIFLTGDFRLESKVLYAFQNIDQVINIQTRMLADTLNLPQILVWDSGTKIPWKNLKSDKIIFCGDQINGELLLHASKLENSYIYTSKTITKDTMVKTPSIILRNAEKQSCQSADAFVKWKQETPKSVADQIALQYNLDSVYLPSLKPFDDSLSGEFTSEKKIYLDRNTIIEQDGSWYAANANGEKELICNAPIHLDSITSFSGSQEVQFTGHILFNGEVLPFTAPVLSDISKPHKTSDWLKYEIAINHGKGFPDIHPKWAKMLFTIAQRMSNPQVVRGAGKVGWDAVNTTYVFPEFAIKDGIQTSSTFEPGSEGPLKHLKKLEAPDFISAYSNGDFSNLAALSIPILHNCICSMTGQTPCKIAIVTSDIDKVAEGLSEAIGRDCYTLSRRKMVGRAIQKISQTHDIPSILKVDDDAINVMLKWSDSEPYANVICVVKETNARLIGLNTDWFFVRESAYDLPWVLENLIKSIPWYIAMAELSSEIRQNPLEMAKTNFLKFISQYIAIEPEVLEGILNKVTWGSIDGQINNDDRFINLILFMLQNQQIQLKHATSPGPKTGVLIHDGAQIVRISKSNLGKLRDLQIPTSKYLIDEGTTVRVGLRHWDLKSEAYLNKK
jgi:hypothetical protein